MVNNMFGFTQLKLDRKTFRVTWGAKPVVNTPLFLMLTERF